MIDKLTFWQKIKAVCILIVLQIAARYSMKLRRRGFYWLPFR